MRLKKALIPLLFLPIASCGQEFSIAVEKSNNIENLTFLNDTSLSLKIASKDTFALFIGDKSTCSTCNQAYENVLSYSKTQNKIIYYSLPENIIGINELTNIQNLDFSLSLIKEGNLIYNFDNLTILNNSKFIRVANQHIH